MTVIIVNKQILSVIDRFGEIIRQYPESGIGELSAEQKNISTCISLACHLDRWMKSKGIVDAKLDELRQRMAAMMPF